MGLLYGGINMKFSIITVCYNSAETIEKTIKSVIAQMPVDIEYIIVDGASTDNTVRLIRKYEECISKWISEPDGGIFDAMNKGISMATGDVIAFINSNDWYEEGALQTVEDAFQKNDCDIVCADNYVIWEKGNITYFDASHSQFDDMYVNMRYYHSALFAKKKWFSEKDNFSLQYKMAADYDWILRSMNKGAKLYYIHQPIFYFTYGGISSVNEIACAWEARNIALKHLPLDKKEYQEKIWKRFYEVVTQVTEQKRRQKIAESDSRYLQSELSFLDLQKPIYLWGAGKRCEECIQWLGNSAKLPLRGVIDCSKDKKGNFVGKLPVISPDDVGKDTELTVIISSTKYERGIREQINTMHWQHLLGVYSMPQLKEGIIEQELKKWSSIE